MKEKSYSRGSWPCLSGPCDLICIYYNGTCERAASIYSQLTRQLGTKLSAHIDFNCMYYFCPLIQNFGVVYLKRRPFEKPPI